MPISNQEIASPGLFMPKLQFVENRFYRSGLIALLGISISFGLSVGPTVQAQTETPANPLKPEADKSKRVEESLALSSSGDLAGAIEVLEGLLADYPSDKQLKSFYFSRLKRRANELVTRGYKSEGYELHRRLAIMARELAKDRADQPGVDAEDVLQFQNNNSYLLYNEACAFAYIGEDDKCLGSLRESMRWGFDNLNFMLNDLDLLEVADRPDFREMLGQELLDYEAKLIESAKERLAEFKQSNFEIIFPDTQGNPRRLSEHGDKLKVVTFWATENGKSQNNLKVLERLADHVDKEKVAIVTVGCEATDDSDEATEALRQFLETKGISLECLVANNDARNQLKRSRGFPTTLLVDGNGRLRLAIPGAVPYHVLKTIVGVLLNESNEAIEPKPTQANQIEANGDGR